MTLSRPNFSLLQLSFILPGFSVPLTIVKSRFLAEVTEIFALKVLNFLRASQNNGQMKSTAFDLISHLD